MKASKLIEKLSQIINQNGDCEVYEWNDILMGHITVESIYYVDENLLNKNLEDNKEYMDNFNKIFHNIIIS